MQSAKALVAVATRGIAIPFGPSCFAVEWGQAVWSAGSCAPASPTATIKVLDEMPAYQDEFASSDYGTADLAAPSKTVLLRV
jgi:hypothetical protein